MPSPIARPSRRTVLFGGAALAVLGPGAGYAATSAFAGTTGSAGPPAGQPVWSADPAVDGLNAFAGIEDDRSHSHPGVKHIFAEGDHYRWNIHRIDRDGADRQRQEVRGMRGVAMRKGDTFSYQYQMFIPDTLKGTTSFTHIFQIKQDGVSAPLVTMNLTRSGSHEQLDMQIFAGGHLAGTDLAPLRNKWIDVQIDVTADDRPAGRLHYVIRDAGQTVVEAVGSGDVWTRGNEAHPKWGIYRSIRDWAQIQDTYLLLRNMRAYRL